MWGAKISVPPANRTLLGVCTKFVTPHDFNRDDVFDWLIQCAVEPPNLDARRGAVRQELAFARCPGG